MSINSLECVKYVCRVGVVSEVESHVRSCPSVWTARLNKLEEKGEEGRHYITPSQRQTCKLAKASQKNVGRMVCLCLRCLRKKGNWIFDKAQTFSTRSMKKSLTSFVLVNFAAMLTRPLERFYKKEQINEIQNLWSFSLESSPTHYFKMWWRCNASHLEISLHLIKSFSLPS